MYRPGLLAASVAVLSLTLTDLAVGQEAPNQVRPAPGLEFAVRSSYIFRFSSDVPAREVPAQAAAAVADVGGQVTFVYTTAIKGFAATMNDVAVNNLLERNPQIVSVERDGIVTMDMGPPPGKGPGGGDGGGSDPAEVVDWGVLRVGGPDLTYADPSRTAWVIDTGIDADHPDLNVGGGINFDCLMRCKADDWDDGNGHGSHVAGTIGAMANDIGVVGVAPGARLYAVRVLNKRGSGSTSGVIAGVDFVAANGSAGDSANMSLIGGASDAMDAAVIAAAQKGIRFALAAGNSGDDASKYSPARVNHMNVFTVSAIDSGDVFASFSNYGNPPVDYAAPGVSVYSTYKDGGYRTLSGTSMAAPHVAGLLLLLDTAPGCDGTASADPDGDPDQIASIGGSCDAVS